MTNETLCTNRKAIEDFIYEITRDWHDDPNQSGLFELRCLGEHRKPVTQRFALHACDEAVDLAVNMNDAKLNIRQFTHNTYISIQYIILCIDIVNSLR